METEYIKNCKHHGLLTEDEVYFHRKYKKNPYRCKKCADEQNKRYRIKNREAYNAYQRKYERTYRKKAKEAMSDNEAMIKKYKMQEYQSKYRIKNKKHIKLYFKKYNKENNKKIREYLKNYFKKNRKKIIEYRKAMYQLKAHNNNKLMEAYRKKYPKKGEKQ